MARELSCYSVADKGALAALRAALRAAVGVRPARLHALSRTYYDTPDRRLYRAGRVLELIERGGERSLVLRALGNGRALATQAIAAPPRFARNLPEGTLRETLAALASPRVLLPVARVRSRVTPLSVLDKQGQVGFVIELDEARLRNGARVEDQALGCWVRLDDEGDGPRKLRERVEALIEGHEGVEDPTRDPFEAALAASADPAPADLSRPKVALEPTMVGTAAVARVLGAYFRTLDANESGVVADLDIEFLHDFRVATRSSRSVLNRLREVFPEREHEKARSDLAWLGKITGPKRDLDVFLGDLDEHTARLPSLWRPRLDPLRAYLGRQRRVEHGRLVEGLTSERYRGFKRDYPAWLARAARRRVQNGPGAGRAVELASRTIWRAYHALLSQGFAVLEDTPVEALHEVRKTGKKLRYLLEAFQALYRPATVRQVVGELKHLQDCLGAIVDRDVQRRLLRHFGDALALEDQAPDETGVAIKMLEAVLWEEEQAHRATFDACWERFARPRTRRLFRALFGPVAAGGADGAGSM
ncbi:MAG: CHAD domain-containing protein [Pseudomonadota bacterium]|nr:CHAD domain-containing protein [Pseudomonadota bacterium]